MSRENLNTESAAEFLGITKNSLEKWRVYGRGPRFVKVGRSVIYRRRDLESYLEARCCSSTSEAAALDAPAS